MPYKGTLQNIYVNFATSSVFTPPAESMFFPFVAVATAPLGRNTFTMQQISMTSALTSYMGGTTYAAGYNSYGFSTNLDMEISAGTQVAILGGWYCTGAVSAQTTDLYMNGGLLIN